MGNILYLVAVILLVGWLIGFFAFSVGAFIHVLLVIALIAFLVRAFSGRRNV